MPTRRAVPPAPEKEEWPGWAPYVSALITLVSIVAALSQRMHTANFPFAVAAGVVAFSPFLLDALGYTINRPLGLPLPVFPIPVLIGVAYLVMHPVSIDLAPFVLVFMTGEIVSRAREQMWVAILAGLASVGVMIGAEVFGPYGGSFIWVIGISFGWFGGYLIQNLDFRTHQLEAAQSELAKTAAADERARIAREVHDVIAHSMSVTMLHITAARMALERDRTPEALDALREAEQQGRTSMSDIRRTVGLLGPDANGAAAPMPGAADLPKLVADFQAAGLDVTLDMSGDVRSLVPAAGLTVFRIAQESLTNVAKHAPGAPARIELVVNADTIRLVVENATPNSAAPSDGGGLGIKGMVERAAVLNGSLVAGPGPDGWSVVLAAPRA